MGGGRTEGEVSRDVLGRRAFWQPAGGYRFNVDSVLLAHFATAMEGPVADLAAGCGIVGLLLAARGLAGPFTAVELDPLAAHCARLNYQQCAATGRVIQADLRDEHPGLRPGGYRLVVCNPPYLRPGHGRLARHQGRAVARTGLSLAPGELWARASHLLTKGGRLAVSWPPARLVEALAGLRDNRLEPKRLRLVHGRLDLPAKTALIEAVKDGGEQLDALPPLIVHAQGQEYTEEVEAIYRGLDLL